MLPLFKSFSYDNLPKNTQGVVAKDGTFFSLGSITTEVQHQINLQYFIEQQLKVDITTLFEQKKHQLDRPADYQLRPGIYDYKALLIDFLGYCNYECYQTTNFAVIDIPLREINGQKITKEQQLTLIRLTELNHNDIDSLIPLFLEDNPFLKGESYQIVGSKIKFKKLNI